MQQDYFKKTVIGGGRFSQVYYVTDGLTGKPFILKQTNLDALKEQDQKYAKQEPLILKRAIGLNYVVQYRNHFVQGNRVFLEMQFCEGGSLAAHLNKVKKPLDQQFIAKLFIQMCMGLDGLHSRRIMHRGLEAENIFLTKDFDVRIGDLGAAKDTTYLNDLSSTMIGPPRVVSPQIANRKSYSQKTDTWSLGCVLYKMCTGRYPFEASNELARKLLICMGKYEPIFGYSKRLMNILQICLQLEESTRPTTRQLLNRPEVREMARESGVEIRFQYQRPHRQRSQSKKLAIQGPQSTNRQTSLNKLVWHQPTIQKPEPQRLITLTPPPEMIKLPVWSERGRSSSQQEGKKFEEPNPRYRNAENSEETSIKSLKETTEEKQLPTNGGIQSERKDYGLSGNPNEQLDFVYSQSEDEDDLRTQLEKTKNRCSELEKSLIKSKNIINLQYQQITELLKTNDDLKISQKLLGLKPEQIEEIAFRIGEETKLRNCKENIERIEKEMWMKSLVK